MNTLSIKKQDEARLSSQNARNKICEVGQLRRAKLHASCLMEGVVGYEEMALALRELLEASLILQTTSTKILAAYLQRSPAAIRAEFQQIRTILGNHDRHSASRTTQVFLASQVNNR